MSKLIKTNRLFFKYYIKSLIVALKKLLPQYLKSCSKDGCSNYDSLDLLVYL